MKQHRFTLQPYKGQNTRHRCPACQHRDKTFVLYLDNETGETLAPEVGRCNRQINCGYHYTPKQYFQDKGIKTDTPLNSFNRKPKPAAPPKPVSFIPAEVFDNSLTNYGANHFVTFLCNRFGAAVAETLVSRYYIGTAKHWNGATVFWQIDCQGKIRTGKIMLYNPATGKRIKEPFSHIHWVHKVTPKTDYNLKQCLFGEHLLQQDKTKTVALVESEKTAIISSVYLPRFTWLAVGSLNNLNPERCSVLKGRNVVLFPDLKGFDKWQCKAKTLSHLARFTVSGLLERKAPEADKEQGLDIADYLLQLPLSDFAAVWADHPGTAENVPQNEAKTPYSLEI